MATLDQLLRELRRRDSSTAAELTAALKISRPTLSRLVHSAGPRVVRLGRGPKTRYCATRQVERLTSPLDVYRIDAQGRPHAYAELDLLEGGAHLLRREKLEPLRFVGLPPFAADMRPQGYLGRAFARAHTELGLSPKVNEWQDDHVLLALALKGEDCVGDVILGRASLQRWSETAPVLVDRDAFPELARQAPLGVLASSAGGDHPKFTACRDGLHLLVKFRELDGSPQSRRWADLLACEALAAQTLAAAGIPAARSEWFDGGGYRFLEVERFDRIGPRGRAGVLSMAALNNEYTGTSGGWIPTALALREQGIIDTLALKRVCFLETFGHQIANGDRHLYNLSFLSDPVGAVTAVAPAYDMLPMDLAPLASGALPSPPQLAPWGPGPHTLGVWEDATRAAIDFWSRVAASEQLTDELRTIAATHGGALRTLLADFGGDASPSPSTSRRSP